MEPESGQIRWIEPRWPYENGPRVLTTLRTGGVSAPPFDSFNLADHVGDSDDAVLENRRRLDHLLGHLPVQWLNQVHGTKVVEASAGGVSLADGLPSADRVPEADGVWTAEQGRVLAVLTADCLPVVLTDHSFQVLAVVHGGWRGLVAGVLAEACAALPVPATIAWLGPAIGPDVYEVGEEVLDAVLAGHPYSEPAVRNRRAGVKGGGKGYLDLFALAELQLKSLGIREVYSERLSTWDTGRFYSYRKEGQTGRMATLAWLPSQSRVAG